MLSLLVHVSTNKTKYGLRLLSVILKLVSRNITFYNGLTSDEVRTNYINTLICNSGTLCLF